MSSSTREAGPGGLVGGQLVQTLLLCLTLHKGRNKSIIIFKGVYVFKALLCILKVPEKYLFKI